MFIDLLRVNALDLLEFLETLLVCLDLFLDSRPLLLGLGGLLLQRVLVQFELVFELD